MHLEKVQKEKLTQTIESDFSQTGVSQMKLVDIINKDLSQEEGLEELSMVKKSASETLPLQYCPRLTILKLNSIKEDFMNETDDSLDNSPSLARFDGGEKQ